MKNSKKKITKEVLKILEAMVEAEQFIDGVVEVVGDEGNAPSLLNEMADLVGIPKDNTVETNACDIANNTGYWPKGVYCRDWIYNAWEDYGRDKNIFIKFLLKHR